jgi:RNA polymerase sigma-70 factor, ECF subfamily
MVAAVDVPDTVELILAEQDHLRRTARRLSRRCDADVDDLVQATLLRAYRARDRFQPGTSIRAWTTTILRRVFFSQMLRAKRRRAEPTDHDPSELLDGAAARPSLQETQLDFDAVLESLDDEVRRALLRLPEIYFVPFYLSAVADYTYGEISRFIGVPVGTVMSRIFRARERLKRDLVPDAFAPNAQTAWMGQKKPAVALRIAS